MKPTLDRRQAAREQMADRLLGPGWRERFDPTPDPPPPPPSRLPGPEPVKRQRAEAWLRQHPGATLAEVAEATGCSVSTAYLARQNLDVRRGGEEQP